jgi:GTP cyclohydrolase I
MATLERVLMPEGTKKFCDPQKDLIRLIAGKRAAAANEKTNRRQDTFMKQPDVNKLAEHYAAILQEIGADLRSEGMRETPVRAAKALIEMTEGSRMDTDALTKQFKAECQEAVCHDMVIVQGIQQVGLCEHHLLPIIMSITIGYVPDKKILGLSKLARIAGYFARRFQNQERTAHLIAEFIQKTVEALGVAVLIDGTHLCAMARGVRDTHSIMKVNVMHGVFQANPDVRREFLLRLERR